jgi:hypothetical protein
VAEAFDFGELRSLLQQAPSEALWEQVCALVFPAKWEKAADQWLPYAEGYLDRSWPDALRTLPIKWASRKRPPSALQLVRHARLEGLTPGQLGSVVELLGAAAMQIAQVSLSGGRALDAQEAVIFWRALEGTLREVRMVKHNLTGPMGLEMAQTAALEGLRSLELREVWMRADAMDALLGSGRLGALRRLWLERMSQSWPMPLVEALEASGLSAQLEVLALIDTQLEASLQPLSRQDWPALRELRLCGVRLDVAALSMLLQAAPQVDALYIGENGLPDAAVAALRQDSARRFTRLDVSRNHFTPLGLEQLLEAPVCASLRELALSWISTGSMAGETLWQSAFAPGLERLHLRSMPSAALFWSGLAGQELPRLHTLELRGGLLDHNAGAALAQASLPALRRLEVQDVTLYASGIDALSRAPWLTQLEPGWTAANVYGVPELQMRWRALEPDAAGQP